ncbi:MAG: pilus assembly protein PilM [Parcubacteria group bacterium]|nr:pilus assembly protein PilM [Parcubacteria group bacterium]
MLNLFKGNTSSFLGIDIGTNSIKLVELESVGGRPRLVTYGMVEVESSIARSTDAGGDALDNQKIAGALSALLKKTGARSRSAVAALPNFSVFSSVISLPKLGEKQLAEAVQWEAKKFVPMPIENVVLDWKILDEEEQKEASGESSEPSERSDKSRQDAQNQSAAPAEKNSSLAACKVVAHILLTAAPRHLVERYVAIFKLAGVALLSLETESFALARSLVGNEAGAILIADVGSLTTDVTVIRKGVPVFSRSINVGGSTVTRAIADGMGISVERAEQFKRDTGIAAAGNSPQQPGAGGVVGIIQQSFSPVISEMRYTLEREQRAGGPIEKILLTGGSAFLSSLPSYISTSLNVKVFIGNPWARVSYPKDLGGVLEQIAPRMGVAIGLAMREIE